MFGKVHLANDETLDIMGQGDVKIKTSNGAIWKLKNARHILNLKKKLILVGQLDEEGYVTTFVGG